MREGLGWGDRGRDKGPGAGASGYTTHITEM